MSDAPTAWRLTGQQQLRHYCWDGQYVVYNDVTGDTHLLDAGAMTLLLALQAGRQPDPDQAGLAADLALLLFIEPHSCPPSLP